MFVRREASLPFANRVPTLRFNNNRNNASARGSADGSQEGRLPPPPLKSSLKPSNFLHPILVARLNRVKGQPNNGRGSTSSFHDCTLTPRNSTLCIVINVKLIGSINAAEEVARMAIDVLTFPNPFITATKVGLFGRLKANLIMIVRALGKMRLQKDPQGQPVLTKNKKMKEMLVNLRKSKGNLNDLGSKCGTFSRYCDGDYNTWASLVEGAIDARLHATKMAEYRLYSDLTLPLGIEDFKTFEDVIEYKEESIKITCTSAAFRLEDQNIEFDQLKLDCQLELVLHMTKFCHILADQSQVVMEACLQRWEADFSSMPVRSGYEQIRDELEELKLDTREDAALHYELQMALESLNTRKMDIVKASNALVIQVKGFKKTLKRVIKFVKQTFNGRIDKKSSCFWHCCEKFMDPEDLIKILSEETTSDITTSLPFTPQLKKVIEMCKPQPEFGELKGFVDIPLSSDGEEGQTRETPKAETVKA